MTGLNLQNIERPITSSFISSRKRWYASFSDISMYLTWVVVFEVFPLLRTSREITLFFLPDACHNVILKNFWTASICFGLMPVQSFQCISFTSKLASSAIFCYRKSFLSLLKIIYNPNQFYKNTDKKGNQDSNNCLSHIYKFPPKSW